jgi:MFS family permease
MFSASTYFHSLRAYPAAFWLLCLNLLVFVMSFNMLLPEMNAYLTELGGADHKWMILGLWTIAAAFARPFSGKIADNISRKSVMYFGILVSVIICFLYPHFISVTGFLVLRFLHGFSTGFHPTGATALIADIVPQGKRGEAMGLFGITVSIGFSAGQAIGSPITIAFGSEGLFMTAALMGLASLFLLLLVKEDKSIWMAKQEFHENGDLVKGLSRIQKIVPKWREIFAPEVVQPSLIMFITAMISGVYLVTVPDMSDYLGIKNKGMFYLVNVIFMVITRFLAGRLYDRLGARRNLYIGLGLMIAGVVITGTSTTVAQFLFSSIVYGVAASICSPVLFAWTADLSNPAFKGRGMSTMFVALELGFAAGAYMCWIVYGNNYANFLQLYLACAALCVVGIVYLFLTRRIKRDVYS